MATLAYNYIPLIFRIVMTYFVNLSKNDRADYIITI